MKRITPVSLSGRRRKRSSATGRRMSAVIGSWLFRRSSCRQMEKPKLGMKGNGCAGSIDSGVSTGKIDWRKVSSIHSFSSSSNCAGRTKWMFSDARYCWRTASEACCSSCSPSTSPRIRSSCSAGLRPSAERVAIPWRTCPSRPATRTMKNSSRLAAEIERKRTRSSSGWFSLSVSSRTRRLNCSQENSRLMKRSGLSSRSLSGDSGVGLISDFVSGTLISGDFVSTVWLCGVSLISFIPVAFL